MTDVDFSDVELNDDHELECPLIDEAEVRMGKRDDGGIDVEVVTTTESGELTIYSDSHKRDFYTKETKREIKNTVEESHPNGETIGAAFLEFCRALGENHKHVQKALRPPAVNDLLNETEKVEIFGGNTATFVITMTHAGKTRRLEFTVEEIMGSNPAGLRDKYGAAFYEKRSLEPEVWEDLAEEWIEMGEEVASERMTETEAIAGELTETLSRRLAVSLDRDGLANDRLTAWYDETNATDNDDVTEEAGDEGTVVWVRTDAIREILKDEGKGKDYFRKLSPELKGMGVTYTTSTRIRTEMGRKRCLGFNPSNDGLGIPRSAAADTEEVLPQ